MQVLPSASVAGLAGTARAQSHSTDAERSAAANQAASAGPIDQGPDELTAGGQTEDRGGDGRMPYEAPDQQGRQESGEGDDRHAIKAHLPGGPGARLDLEG